MIFDEAIFKFLILEVVYGFLIGLLIFIWKKVFNH